jgi:hypothetical protein
MKEKIKLIKTNTYGPWSFSTRLVPYFSKISNIPSSSERVKKIVLKPIIYG